MEWVRSRSPSVSPTSKLVVIDELDRVMWVVVTSLKSLSSTSSASECCSIYAVSTSDLLCAPTWTTTVIRASEPELDDHRHSGK
jgi:hypothetical protein